MLRSLTGASPLVILGLAATTAACTAADPAGTAVGSASSGIASAADGSSTPSTSVNSVQMPNPDPGTDTLMKASGTGNSSRSWEVDVRQGSAWIALNCLGDGTIRVSLRPAADFSITCDGSSVTPSLNKLSVSDARTWTVRISAPEAVHWAIRVSQ